MASYSRRAKGRILAVCNSWRNAEDGGIDKQDLYFNLCKVPYDLFWQCSGCEQVYREGNHVAEMSKIYNEIKGRHRESEMKPFTTKG